MKPTEGYGLMPLVGMEVEVPTWKHSVADYRSVAKSMIAEGYMDQTYAKKWHTWKCTCAKCTRWDDELIAPWPVQWKTTYDGSIPEEGAEFITSPFIPTALYVDEIEKAFKLICDNALWTMEMEAKNGGPCSPSIHIHTSIQLPQNRKFNETRFSQTATSFYPFVPELFAIADSSNLGQNRGLSFRSPHSKELLGHHAYLSPVAHHQSFVHCEWRIWEAAFQDWPYVRSAIYFSSAMMQLLTNSTTYSNMLERAGGFALTGSDLGSYDTAIRVKDLTDRFDLNRLEVLEAYLLEHTFLRFDFVAGKYVQDLFDRTRRKFSA